LRLAETLLKDRSGAETWRAILREEMKRDGDYRYIGLLNSSYRVTAATNEQLEGRSFPEFVRAVVGPREVTFFDLHFAKPNAELRDEGTSQDLEKYLEALETDCEPTVAYVAPIRAKENVAGLIAVWVKARAFWDIIRAGDAKAGRKSYISLLDGA